MASVECVRSQLPWVPRSQYSPVDIGIVRCASVNGSKLTPPARHAAEISTVATRFSNPLSHMFSCLLIFSISASP